MDGNDQLFTLAQALADPLRLVMLQQLMEGPATVSELQSLTGESQSKVSNHLALLRERDLVRATREGRQMIYTLRDASVGQLVESLTVVAGVIRPSSGNHHNSLLHEPATITLQVAMVWHFLMPCLHKKLSRNQQRCTVRWSLGQGGERFSASSDSI